MDPFFSGVAIGFAIAAPVGPIGLLCIRRTLAGGVVAGFISGLGAASADTLYAACAAFALTLATAFVARAAPPLHVAGGVVLVILGLRTALASASSPRVESSAPCVSLRAFATTFALTVVNPATLVSFGGVIASGALGSGAPAGPTALLLVGGVFVGSALWWLVLSAAVGSLRRTLTPRLRRAIALASGITLIGFGAWSLVKA
jgi:threonine/homoserine/homoserine lactone efflux protein